MRYISTRHTKEGGGPPAIGFDDERFNEFARRVFDRFRCPILRVEVSAEGRWHVARIRPLSFGELSLEQQDRFRAALDDYTRASWRIPKTTVVPRM